MVKISIIHANLVMEMKEKNRGSQIITQDFLKEMCGRVGTRFGWFPHFLQSEVIEELIELKLLERMNQMAYRIIPNKESEELERKIKKIKKNKN